MERARNDATLNKIGDIYQYYIALRDCFEMKIGDRLQIEVNGDVSFIANTSGDSFQKEVKHHLGKKNLSDRDEDFWKTLSNWYLEYDRIASFSKLVLHTTATVSSKSSFRNWNTKSAKEKIAILREIGVAEKKREAIFRGYYIKIFDEQVYDEDKLSNIVSKFTIESSKNQIPGISEEFSCFVGHIPDCNRDNYIGALLGRILAIVKEPPHVWEMTREKFDEILQQESPAHSNPSEKPLPTDFALATIPENEKNDLLQKNFVKAIRKINFDKKISNAVSDYWKTEMTIMKYFKEDFLYLQSFPIYQEELKNRLDNAKERAYIIATSEGQGRSIEIKHSKLMYTDIMDWNAKDFGSIVRNQDYFQRGVIHTIVDEGKFNWDVGAQDES